MKSIKIFGLLLFIFGSIFTVNAQKYDGENDDFNATETPYKLGVKIGLTTSQVVNPTLKNIKSVRGLNIGFYYRREMGKSLHFQTELNGVLCGSKFSNGLDGYSRFSILYMQMRI